MSCPAGLATKFHPAVAAWFDRSFAAPTPAQAEIHPDAVSSFLTRTYTIKPKKLWKGLLQALTDEGYPPEEVDDERRHLKTSFVDVESKGESEPFENAVGPPPRFGPDYPIFQQIHVNQGKVSLEALVAPEGRGSALSIRARILVGGLDRRRRARILTDRRSSGLIEKRFLEKLENRLDLHTPTDVRPGS